MKTKHKIISVILAWALCLTWLLPMEIMAADGNFTFTIPLEGVDYNLPIEGFNIGDVKSSASELQKYSKNVINSDGSYTFVVEYSQAWTTLYIYDENGTLRYAGATGPYKFTLKVTATVKDKNASDKPTIKKIKSASSGVRFSWRKVKGAEGYEVSRKAAGGYSGKKTISYFNTPVLKEAKSVSKGVELTWGGVDGASYYAVHRKKNGGSWEALATTKKTSYTDKTAKKGVKYYYRVCCVTKNGERKSGYSSSKSVTRKKK